MSHSRHCVILLLRADRLSVIWMVLVGDFTARLEPGLFWCEQGLNWQSHGFVLLGFAESSFIVVRTFPGENWSASRVSVDRLVSCIESDGLSSLASMILDGRVVSRLGARKLRLGGGEITGDEGVSEWSAVCDLVGLGRGAGVAANFLKYRKMEDFGAFLAGDADGDGDGDGDGVGDVRT